MKDLLSGKLGKILIANVQTGSHTTPFLHCVICVSGSFINKRSIEGFMFSHLKYTYIVLSSHFSG